VADRNGQQETVALAQPSRQHRHRTSDRRQGLRQAIADMLLRRARDRVRGLGQTAPGRDRLEADVPERREAVNEFLGLRRGGRHGPCRPWVPSRRRQEMLVQSGPLNEAADCGFFDRFGDERAVLARRDFRDAQVGQPAFAQQARMQLEGDAQATDLRIVRIAGRHRHEIGRLVHLREEIGGTEFLPQDRLEARMDRRAHFFPAHPGRRFDRVELDRRHAAAAEERLRRGGLQMRIEDMLSHDAAMRGADDAKLDRARFRDFNSRRGTPPAGYAILRRWISIARDRETNR